MRHVVIPVHDPEVTHLLVEHEHGEMCLDDGLGGVPRKEERVPVPQDDQLARDVARLLRIATAYAIHEYWPGHPRREDIHDTVGRLRAAFNLEDE